MNKKHLFWAVPFVVVVCALAPLPVRFSESTLLEVVESGPGFWQTIDYSLQESPEKSDPLATVGYKGLLVDYRAISGYYTGTTGVWRWELLIGFKPEYWNPYLRIGRIFGSRYLDLCPGEGKAHEIFGFSLGRYPDSQGEPGPWELSFSWYESPFNPYRCYWAAVFNISRWEHEIYLCEGDLAYKDD